ncbi:hypothetical protein HYX70_01370 [Candidatus Saccharibacteria bacterium]|nr:hypothetical protein [Candidatus Saccharibacteria bacterium]
MKAKKVQRQVKLSSPNDPATPEALGQPDESESEASSMANHKSRRSRWHRWLKVLLIVLLIGLVAAAAAWNLLKKAPADGIVQPSQPNPSSPFVPATGKVLQAEAPAQFTPEQVRAMVLQTNPRFDLPVQGAVTKQVFSYTSSDGQSDKVPVYARVYVPSPTSASNQLPVLAFGPGTTGLGDQCAASLENPAKRNWANYDSLMMSYASQGYVVVITDYEGMRDPARIQRYMVGDLEGRAVLDSVRALRNLELSRDKLDNSRIFAGGYSQGGHAAYWADKIQATYAPDISLRGAIGFGPVTSVEQTWADTAGTANINWFGPFILVAYGDWYRQIYPISDILQARWVGALKNDALRECIDTVNNYWPSNVGLNRSNTLYTPQFLQSLRSGDLKSNPKYRSLAWDLYQNIVGNSKSATPKLINQGRYDNVILPSQSTTALRRYCTSGNNTYYRSYDQSPAAVNAFNPKGLVDHYTIMAASFRDTLAWMELAAKDQLGKNSC